MRCDDRSTAGIMIEWEGSTYYRMWPTQHFSAIVPIMANATCHTPTPFLAHVTLISHPPPSPIACRFPPNSSCLLLPSRRAFLHKSSSRAELGNLGLTNLAPSWSEQLPLTLCSTWSQRLFDLSAACCAHSALCCVQSSAAQKKAIKEFKSVTSASSAQQLNTSSAATADRHDHRSLTLLHLSLLRVSLTQ